MYFVIAAANVDPVSVLLHLPGLYQMRLEKSRKADALKERLSILIEDITKSVFVNICRGLFGRHKLLFAFQIAVDILKHKGEITASEWKTFLLGPTESDLDVEIDEGSAFCLFGQPEKVRACVFSLENQFAKSFVGLLADIENRRAVWKSTYQILKLVSRPTISME